MGSIFSSTVFKDTVFKTDAAPDNDPIGKTPKIGKPSANNPVTGSAKGAK